MKKFRFELVLLVLMFAVMTFFFVVVINQFRMNDTDNLYYNNFYSPNAIKFSIGSNVGFDADSEAPLDPTKIDGSFVIYNVLEDRLSSESDYDRVRIVYGVGDSYTKPRIDKGRYFTEEDMTSDELLCIVGKEVFDRSVNYDGTFSFYDTYSGRRLVCKVIGVMGLRGGIASDLDTTVMVNWGGYYNGYTLNSGTFIVDADSSAKAERVYSQIEIGFSSAGDTSRDFYIGRMRYSGTLRSFSYYTKYLFILGSLVFTVNIIMIALHYCDRRKHTVAVKKLCGFADITVYLETTGLIAAMSMLGACASFGIINILRTFSEFTYSEIGWFTELSADIVFFALVFSLVYSAAVASIPSFKAYCTDTSEALR